MTGRKWLPALALVFAIAHLTNAEELKEIFYAPFDTTPNAVQARGSATSSAKAVQPNGKIGKWGNGTFDARGNVDLDRGTMAFWLNLPKGPSEMDWDGYVMVKSTPPHGYYRFIMAPLMAIPEHFCMQFFDVGSYTQRMDWPSLVGRWKAGEWHHVAMVWDRNEGITVYEDGKRIGSTWGSAPWAWNIVPRHLQLTNQVDDFHIYAVPLTDAQIAQLAKGEAPTGEPIPITAPEKRRQADLARMGWLDEDIKELPVVAAGQPQQYDFARIVKAWDAKRAYTELFDGFKAAAWPHQQYGHGMRGQFAELQLAPGQSYDRATLFVQRAFKGEIQEFVAGVGYKTLKPVDARDGTFWRTSLGTPRSDAKIGLTRSVGRLGQVQLYRVQPMKAEKKSQVPLYFSKLEKMPDSDAGLSLLAETATRFDNPVRATVNAAESWKIQSPAFGGFQAIIDAKAEPVAADGVLITLVAEGMTKPTPVQIVIKEPVWLSRDWLVADALLQPSATGSSRGSGKQVFTLRLRGRPVVSMPNVEFALTVTAGEPVTWLMGKDGSSVQLCSLTMEQALPAATEDQTEFVRSGFYNVNEGHLFREPIFDAPFRWMLHFAPQRPETRELVYQLGIPKDLADNKTAPINVPAPAFEIPKNAIGAPEWAFWQMQDMNISREITHWWIDNWQTPNGEFGGLWGDDTDFVENWIGMAMCADDEGRIKGSLRRTWHGLWNDCLEEGVSRYTMDDVHSFEEGMGTITYQMLVDYGDPVAVEHVMAASSHYDKWLRKLDDGTYRWRSKYFGVNGCWDYGAFADDSDGAKLMLIPADYLIWYNRNPHVAKYFRGLKGLATATGISTDSYYLLTDPAGLAPHYAKLLPDKKYVRYHQRLNGMMDAIGITDEARKALALPEYKLQTLDKYPFSAQHDDSRNWMYYRLTDDIRYLVDTYKAAFMLISNQRWLYTAADASRDRIPLPDNSIINARMGALVTQRGAQGTYLPWHGLSYVKGANDVAALVTVNTDKELTCRFYAFPQKEHDLTVRVWRLLPGIYKVTLAKDANDDGKPEETIWEKKDVALDRGAFLDLKLPSRQPMVLTITAIKTEQPNYDLPDAAISPTDTMLLYWEHLTVPVHNLGTKPVENLLVRVRDGLTGKVIGEKTIARIDPPNGLRPSKTSVEFLNFNCISKGSLIVEIDPDNKVPDLNRYNNRVVHYY